MQPCKNPCCASTPPGFWHWPNPYPLSWPWTWPVPNYTPVYTPGWLITYQPNSR